VETLPQSFSSLTFLLLITALAVFLVYRVFRRLGTTTRPSTGREVDIEELGGFSYVQLVSISVLGLFLEMLMIRWVSSEIRIFAYFKNFVLVACFLGFGLGCYLCRRRVQLMALTAPLLLLALFSKRRSRFCAAASLLCRNCWEPALKCTCGAYPQCPRVGQACCWR
jgi:hypothetical protein